MNLGKVFCTIALPGMVLAAQGPTKAQAEALVKQAVAFGKQNGIDKLIQETNQATGKFHVASGGELYIMIYDQTGVCKAIGYNTGMFVGKNRAELKDPDGKYPFRELIKIAKTTGKGWVDYKYPNPVNGKIEAKTTYLEMYGDLIVGAGVYKD